MGRWPPELVHRDCFGRSTTGPSSTFFSTAARCRGVARRAHGLIEAHRLADPGAARGRRPGRRQREQRGAPGPNAQLYEINPDAAYVAGLDVTPARMRAAVADITGRIVGEFELPTPRKAGTDTVERVSAAIEGAAGERRCCTAATLTALVIGTPGAFDPGTQRLRYARHLPGWHDPDLLDAARRTALGAPLEVDNDVNLAASPSSTSASPGERDFVLLWGEEGLGAAVVIDGPLHRGATGGAGEVGFLPLPGTPLVRNVGRQQRRRLPGARRRQSRCSSWPGGSACAPALAEVAVPRRWTRRAQATSCSTTCRHRLAVGLAAIVSVLDPELVVLTGGVLTAGGERLLDAVSTDCRPGRRPSTHSSCPASRDKPVLRGALLQRPRPTRDDVFNTIRVHPSRDAARRARHRQEESP